MPLIKVTHPADALSAEAKEQLAEGLTSVLLTIEGGYDTPSGRALAYVVFEPVQRTDWYVGGSNGLKYQRGPERILVDVTVPEAATSQTQKREIYTQVHDLLAKVLGWSTGPGNINAWVIVHEVPEGNWGMQGETFGIVRLAEYVGEDVAKPNPDRVAFVSEYFAAKDKAYAAAGYPSDVSGLMQPQK